RKQRARRPLPRAQRARRSQSRSTERARRSPAPRLPPTLPATRPRGAPPARVDPAPVGVERLAMGRGAGLLGPVALHAGRAERRTAPREIGMSFISTPSSASASAIAWARAAGGGPAEPSPVPLSPSGFRSERESWPSTSSEGIAAALGSP